ncbi:MAG: rRNA pseudouridine synthase [Rikenellaceae bacterium]|nr:rRNA pseudouridine synthase [Rikenellaceae bacterium]MCL2692000.1 rRNA pseudouridine synthase [Rikenellaceae bacterium]
MDKKDPENREKRDFNREDSGRRNDSKPFTPFAKDKRARITHAEKNEPRRREHSENHDSPRPPRENGPKPYRREEIVRKPASSDGRRRSYNPNFTPDNKFRENDRFNRTDDKPRTAAGRERIGGYKPHGERPERDFNRADSPRPARKPYGDKPYGDKPRGAKPPYKKFEKKGDRPFEKKFDKKFDKKPHAKRSDHGRYSDGTYPAFTPPEISDEIRLNRYIAAAGKSSRREADEMIRAGRVKVNGDVVTEMGAKISAHDVVRVDGEVISSEKKVYIIMNKPKGFVTTLEDPHAEKTVMDLLKNSCTERVYPVGRLDKNSLGVLLITNDGDLTTQLTHPSHNKKKIYQVLLDKPLTRADMQKILDSIVLEDGPITADAIDYVSESKKEIGIEVHSGRNRIVRRIFEFLGYKVQKLDRVYFAGLTKKNLKRGQWRFLTPKEVGVLKSGMYE